MTTLPSLRFVCLDWGGTLMSEDGPTDIAMAHWPQVVVIDGAREMMQALARRYTLCIATNASVSRRADIELALKRAGLLRHVSDIFCYTEIGARKDSARFWQVVCAALDAQPAEIAMLGDTLEQDVLAPRRYGIRSIWFNPQGAALPNGSGSVTMVRRLDEVDALLARLQ